MAQQDALDLAPEQLAPLSRACSTFCMHSSARQPKCMKSLLISILLLIGCARPHPQTTTIKPTPLPTLMQPHAWFVKAYPDTHCMAYLNVDAGAQHVTWLTYAWDVPSGGSLLACPGRLKVCETVHLETCREVASP